MYLAKEQPVLAVNRNLTLEKDIAELLRAGECDHGMRIELFNV